MVRVSCILVGAISMLQTTKVHEHYHHQVCTGVKKGDVARFDGHFNGRTVGICEVAEESGTFCLEKDAFA